MTPISVSVPVAEISIPVSESGSWKRHYFHSNGIHFFKSIILIETDYSIDKNIKRYSAILILNTMSNTDT